MTDRAAVKINVFCLPNLSPANPVIIRLTELTPLETASKVAPKEAEKPMATEYSARNVRGSPFPPACKNAAPTLNRNAGFMANLRLTCVDLRPMNRDGVAVMAIGREITTFKKARARRVHRGPMDVRRKRIRGENTKPPIPAPERMKPMADPRWVVKYSGALERMGK